MFEKSSSRLASLLLLTVLASCGKYSVEEPLRDSAVTVMAESLSDGTHTKAAVTTEVLPDDYTIFLSSYYYSYDSPEFDGDYFVSTPFNSDGHVWRSSPVIYWPVGGYLDFLALATESTKTVVDSRTEWYRGNCSLGVQYTMPDGSHFDNEVLFSVADNRTSAEGTVNMQFHHSQAYLQFFAEGESDGIYKIDSIVINSAYAGGVLKIARGIYTRSEWEYRNFKRMDVTVPGSEGDVLTAEKQKVCEILLPEQDACDLTVYYTIRANTSAAWETAQHYAYRHPAGKDPWFYGEKTVFNISFTVETLSMSVGMNPWTDEDNDTVVTQNNGPLSMGCDPFDNGGGYMVRDTL